MRPLAVFLTTLLIVPSMMAAKPAAPQRSSFKFPSRVGLFVREGAPKLDAGGDPYAQYWAGSLILATVYYYQTRGHTLAREFADCKNEVRRYTPKAQLISDSRMTGRPQPGLRAIFIARSGALAARGPAKSQLVIFQIGDRFLKYRITYQLAHAERADREVDDFVRRFPWPAG